MCLFAALPGNTSNFLCWHRVPVLATSDLAICSMRPFSGDWRMELKKFEHLYSARAGADSIFWAYLLVLSMLQELCRAFFLFISCNEKSLHSMSSWSPNVGTIVFLHSLLSWSADCPSFFQLVLSNLFPVKNRADAVCSSQPVRPVDQKITNLYSCSSPS